MALRNGCCYDSARIGIDSTRSFEEGGRRDAYESSTVVVSVVRVYAYQLSLSSLDLNIGVLGWEYCRAVGWVKRGGSVRKGGIY